MPLGMLLLLFCQRQRKDKLRTNAFRADTVDIFSMCLDDFFYNGKSKSGTLLVFSAGEVCLVETIPDLFDAVFWNADSGVFDGNKDFLIFFGRLDRDCGVCVAEFERIVDQVIKYLLDLAEISGDKQGETDMLFHAGSLKSLYRHADRMIDIKACDIEHDTV